jgi:hypothetical protein
MGSTAVHPTQQRRTHTRRQCWSVQLQTPMAADARCWWEVALPTSQVSRLLLLLLPAMPCLFHGLPLLCIVIVLTCGYIVCWQSHANFICG